MLNLHLTWKPRASCEQLTERTSIWSAVLAAGSASTATTPLDSVPISQIPFRTDLRKIRK